MSRRERGHWVDPSFKGVTYDPELDHDRLSTQMEHVRGVMLTSTGWLTLRELEDTLGYPQASISARLRQLRAEGHDVQRRRRGNPKLGIWEYRCARREPKQERLF